MTSHRPRPIDVFHDECMARAEAERQQQAAAPRRVLTAREYTSAWHAVEGAAGEEGADPATILGAVLTVLGIDPPHAVSRPTVEEIADADNPTRLRWGLNDVMWGDDDSVTVLLSDEERRPYWLELDPERAAVLREDLASPA